MCYVRERAGRGPWVTRAEGFRPGSVLRVRFRDEPGGATPLTLPVRADGSLAPASGVVVPSGTVTVVLDGTARNGAAVHLEFTLPA